MNSCCSRIINLGLTARIATFEQFDSLNINQIQKKMKAVFTLLVTILTMSGAYAQGGQMLSAEDSDPKATVILDDIRKEFESFQSMEADFHLTIELPEQGEEVQKGKIIQQGDNYVVDLEQQAIYSNGEAIWLHVKKNNEVQINDADTGEDSDMLSPKDMMRIYESGDYVYFISDTPTVEGRKMNQIDFKPLDSDSEYFKIVLLADKSTNKMAQMHIFSKDGSKFKLKIDNIVANKAYEPAVFTFDQSKYPGIYIEDLRID